MALVSKTSIPKGIGGSNPSPSAKWDSIMSDANLKVYQSDGMGFNKQRFLRSDVVILGGRIVKNRHGKAGQDIGGAFFVWDEREEV